MITSTEVFSHRIDATCRLLVMTRSRECFSSARATSSLVVPMLMNSEESFGMCWAQSAAIRCFSVSCCTWRVV